MYADLEQPKFSKRYSCYVEEFTSTRMSFYVISEFSNKSAVFLA